VSEAFVRIDDTSLFVETRGDGEAVIVLHGGPGLDHHEFGDYLDPLADTFRLLLVDQRSCGRSEPTPPTTWTLERHAQDVVMLARALRLERFAVLGHSYGAFVALQSAVDFPGMASRTIVSSGIPSMRFLGPHVEANLAAFEPEALRPQVVASWAGEPEVATTEGFARLLEEQLPFHFADPLDPRIAGYLERTKGAIYAPDVLRHSSAEGYGGIEVEDRLGLVTSPTLVLAGRHDRTCSVEAARAIASGITGAELVIFEHSGHMTFVEEPGAYVEAVRTFLLRT
jgi:proline iminopeptidase